MLWSRKSLVSALLALVFSIMILVPVNISLSVPVTTQTDSAITVYLDPPTISGTVINQTFTVNINITGAINITDWGIGLRFNATLLNCTGFFQGEFLQSIGETLWTPALINNTAGVVGVHSCNFQGLYWANGSGRLAYATFKVKALGVSDIHLYNIQVATRVYDENRMMWIPVMVSFNIIDVYTVVLDTTVHTVVTVSNSTGKTGNYGSGFYNHAFSVPDKEISFTVSHAGKDPSDPNPSFSNISIPKTLLEPSPTYGWAVIIDGNRLSTTEPIVTENTTHTFIYFTYAIGTHTIQITTRFLVSTITITASSTTVAVGSGVNISGGIYPVPATVVNVTIQYSASAWTTLATVPTDLNGNYSYIWTPETIGTYELKASWEGDSNTLDAVSEVLALDTVLRDLEVSLDAPSVLLTGRSCLLNATVYNSGTFNETDVELQLLINGSVKANDTISLLSSESYTLSYLWTPDIVEADYNVTAYAPPKIVSGVGAENDTTNNVATKFVEVKSLFISPKRGPVGTKVTVEGVLFGNQTQVNVTFNDMLIGYAMTDENGAFTFDFNVPLSVAGEQKIKAFNAENSGVTTFTVVDMTPLDIEIDVGATHFRGESADFYIQITFKGAAVNATSINATLYGPNNEVAYYQYPQNITLIATGFYKITYLILEDALNGTYALVIDASYVTSTIEAYGTSFKTFFLSLTLTDELALIEGMISDLNETIKSLDTRIRGNLMVINEALMAINATLTYELAQIAAVNEALMAINTTLTYELAAVNATLQSINETLSQLETRIDAIKGAQEAFTLPLYAAVALALIGAIGAIVTIYLRRKPTP